MSSKVKRWECCFRWYHHLNIEFILHICFHQTIYILELQHILLFLTNKKRDITHDSTKLSSVTPWNKFGLYLEFSFKLLSYICEIFCLLQQLHIKRFPKKSSAPARRNKPFAFMSSNDIPIIMWQFLPFWCCKYAEFAARITPFKYHLILFGI